MYMNPYKSGGVANFLLPGAAIGVILYVHDVDGDDDALNTGLDPASPLQTLTEALTRCTSSSTAPDHIILLEYGNDPTLDASWPIVVDVDFVQIIAAQYGSFLKAHVSLDSDGDFDCLSIQAHSVRVQGIRFYSGAGSTKAGVTFAGSSALPAVLDCLFESGRYGVYSPTGGTMFGLEVSNCVFVSQSSHGIYIDDDPATNRFANNTFTLTVDNSIGIEVTAGGNTQILDNRFSTSDASPVNGWGITMSGIATDALISGNEGMIAKLIPGATPFVDTTAAGNCNWGVNWTGIGAVYPT